MCKSSVRVFRSVSIFPIKKGKHLPSDIAVLLERIYPMYGVLVKVFSFQGQLLGSHNINVSHLL